MQRHTEQEVLQANPAALHKVWVHVVSRELVPHKLSLHTNTSGVLLYSLQGPLLKRSTSTACICPAEKKAEPGSALNSPASQAVEEQQCRGRSPSGSSAEVQTHCISSIGSLGPDYGHWQPHLSFWKQGGKLELGRSSQPRMEVHTYRVSMR